MESGERRPNNVIDMGQIHHRLHAATAFYNSGFKEAAAVIVDELRESINANEPRVVLDDVKAYPDFENNSFDVIIVYNIVGAEIPPQELQFVLQSSR